MYEKYTDQTPPHLSLASPLASTKTVESQHSVNTDADTKHEERNMEIISQKNVKHRTSRYKQVKAQAQNKYSSSDTTDEQWMDSEIQQKLRTSPSTKHQNPEDNRTSSIEEHQQTTTFIHKQVR